MPPRTETWSYLPPELLVTIADHHSTHLGILRLRSICRSWRNAVSPDLLADASSIWSARIPFPIITPIDLYTLTKSNICYIQSPSQGNGWLVKVEEFRQARLRAMDPVSSIRMLGFPKELNLVDLRVFEIAMSFRFSILDIKNAALDLNLISKKVVVSSVDGNVKCDDLVMVIFNGGSLLHIRVGDGKWGELQEWQVMKLYSDVIFWKERFYAVDGGGGLVIVDMKLNVEICPWLGPPQDSCEKKYLIEAGGRLYLVVKKNLSAREGCGEDTAVGQVSEEEEISRVWFEVFCFKEEEKDWVQVYGLGELAFFVADDCSFSVVARDCPPYQRNCIYYADYDVGDSTAQSYGVFDLEKKVLSEARGNIFISFEGWNV